MSRNSGAVLFRSLRFEAIVKIANMDKPLALFVTGADALEMLIPVAEGRLKTMRENAEISKSTAIS
jgi:hypothetical protein